MSEPTHEGRARALTQLIIAIKAFPEQRLGQIIFNATNGADPFYWSDDKFARYLEKYVETGERPDEEDQPPNGGGVSKLGDDIRDAVLPMGHDSKKVGRQILLAWAARADDLEQDDGYTRACEREKWRLQKELEEAEAENKRLREDHDRLTRKLRAIGPEGLVGS